MRIQHLRKAHEHIAMAIEYLDAVAADLPAAYASHALHTISNLVDELEGVVMQDEGAE